MYRPLRTVCVALGAAVLLAQAVFAEVSRDTTVDFDPAAAASLQKAYGAKEAGILRAAILDSQQRGQKFRDFSRRAMEAGVAGYFAFLRGQRVTYFGRAGDQHTEWFPGAAPAE